LKSISLGIFSVVLLQSCAGSSHETLNPKHIETPEFPPLARAARIMGEVKLSLTIDADGHVKSVNAMTNDAGEKPNPILQKYCEGNISKWTFSKPSHTPFFARDDVRL
jgi:Gram-negative bacterial TonB protein C-terminal